MAKLVTFFVLFFTILSCNYNNNEEKISQLNEKIVQQKAKNDSILKVNYTSCKDEKGYLESQLKRELNQEKRMDSFLLKKRAILSLDNKKIIDFFFKEINLEEFDADTAIKFSWLIHPAYRRYAIYSETMFANYMIANIDRTPESLEAFFTPEIKEQIYSLLRRQNLYKDCGAYTTVKALLMAYEGFEYEQERLSSIYQIAKKSKYKNVNEVKAIISSMVSEEVLETLSDENYSTYKEASENSSVEHRLYTIYTFWARRHQENNIEFTYYFLKELHESIAYE